MSICRPVVNILMILGLTISETWAVGNGHAPWVGSTFAGRPCTGTAVGNFGPWDYIVNKEKLAVVENAHFTPRVQHLSGGENAAGPTTDIDYTLKTFPNHHLALNSAMQFRQLQVAKMLTLSVKGHRTGYELRSPVECYLQRAVNYRPKDPTSLMLYGVFLQREGMLQEAGEQYEKALEVSPTSPDIQYNYALLLVQLEQYGQAREIAVRLYSEEYPLNGLKKKLVAADEW